MKYLILAVGFAAALGLSHMITPAQAQSAEDIRRTCYNKHNLGKYASAASEQQRKDVEARRRACVASKGKS